MPDSNLEYRNQTYSDKDEEDSQTVYNNSHGYQLLNSCSFSRYFTQGTEILSDQRTLLLSSGLYAKSKIMLIQFDMNKCSFKTTFEKKIEDKYFAEGVTVANDD